MIWFTADQHYGHTNIIKYCDRPFKNSDIMDNILIQNHNSVVKNNDDVYIVGDFSMAKEKYRNYYRRIVKRLNGRLHLILGNHDVKNAWFYVNIGFQSVHVPYLKVEEFICAHDPALSVTDKKVQFICGHIHDLFDIYKNCINVGVDVRKYTPISIDGVRKIFIEHSSKTSVNNKDVEFFKEKRDNRRITNENNIS